MDEYIDLEVALQLAHTSNANSGTDESHWSQPDLALLGTGRRHAPTFPLNVLGSRWADWVERRARDASSPVDYVASALLASVGALLANVRWPLAGASWTEPPLLWIGLVGSPSSGKSPAMDAASSLIQRVEDRMAAEFRDQVSAYETEKVAAEARRDTWKGDMKAAVKGGAEIPARPDDAIIPEPPIQPRIRVADATVEKLAVLAAALPRGLLMVRDELAGWLGAFDRYGGSGSDRAFAVEMYGGRSYRVDRMRTTEPLSIRHLSIGILGGIQPDKVSGVLNGPDDGLVARFLWSWPDALPRFDLARELPHDTAAHHAFERLSALGMSSDPFGNPEPTILKLEPKAEDVLEAFAREMADHGREAVGAFAGALGKARGHALRLATILEFLWWSGEYGGPEPTYVSDGATAAACHLLGCYFIAMAERVYGDAAIPAPERHAMTLVRHLRRERLASFNARMLGRQIGGVLRVSSTMNAACSALEEAGLIRTAHQQGGAGRPAHNYEVNSVVHRAAPA